MMPGDPEERKARSALQDGIEISGKIPDDLFETNEIITVCLCGGIFPMLFEKTTGMFIGLVQ
jgi:hypothetical protein